MALDGITVSCIVSELREKLTMSRIDKIYQPESDELIFSIRASGENHRLLLSANASQPRVHLTREDRENPMTAPLFCMVLRKHLSGGRITDISQPGLERIISIIVESLDEMGDITEKKLIIELMGKHSNIMLIDDKQRIIDSIKHITHETSSVREVLPGKTYVSPPSQGKSDPFLFDAGEFAAKISIANVKIQSLIYQSYSGISPVMASEICFRSNIDPSNNCAETAKEHIAVAREFVDIIENIRLQNFRPTLYYDEDGNPYEYCAFEMQQYSSLKNKSYESISHLLEEFYSGKGEIYRLNQKTQDLRKIITLNIDRCAKKSELLQKTLKETENMEQNRIYGELIRANMYVIHPGQEVLIAENYFDSNCPPVNISLDKNKTPSENMQKYFKLYNKQKRAFAAANQQAAQNAEELLYFESVLASVANCRSLADIEEIRSELAAQGIIKNKKENKKKKNNQRISSPLLYRSGDGFDILVGKNNLQNDELTLRTARPGDLWLHTKNIPGSHVIIKTDGKSVPDNTITEAAKLASWHSAARGAAQTGVDYCPRKNVKKPNGAKPGMVIYENYRTAYVSCGKDEAEALLVR